MSRTGNKWPASAQGIVEAVNFYIKKGYDVFCFVPRHYLKTGSGKKKIDNPELFKPLQDSGALVVVPSQDHDDDYWLNFAWQKEAYAVTNDRMKDHMEKYPNGGETGFYKWRDEKVISYTFVGDTYFPNPTFNLPPPTKGQIGESSKKGGQIPNSSSKKSGGNETSGDGKGKPEKNNTKTSGGAKKLTSKPMKKGEKPTVRKARKAFRDLLRAELSDGPVNCGLLASQISELASASLSYPIKNRKELMGVMNIKTSLPFHEQLSELMGGELIVDLVKGQPVDVRLRQPGKVSSTKQQSDPKASNQTKPKGEKRTEKPLGKSESKRSGGRDTRKRISLTKFKSYLTEDEINNLKISIYELPELVELAIPFIADLEYPCNYADVGNRFKAKFGFRISTLFGNIDNLIKFINFRYEFPQDNLVREGDIIGLEDARVDAGSSIPKSANLPSGGGGILSKFFSFFKNLFS